jgi:hypothetical protein
MIYYLSKENYRYVKIPMVKWLTVLLIIIGLSFIVGKNYGKSDCKTQKQKNERTRVS